MPVGIFVEAFASNGAPVLAWLQAADVNAHDGRGAVTTTRDQAHALAFATHAEAFAFWQRQSTVRPLRGDGKPNRPLTAYTVTVRPL